MTQATQHIHPEHRVPHQDQTIAQSPPGIIVVKTPAPGPQQPSSETLKTESWPAASKQHQFSNVYIHQDTSFICRHRARGVNSSRHRPGNAIKSTATIIIASSATATSHPPSPRRKRLCRDPVGSRGARDLTMSPTIISAPLQQGQNMRWGATISPSDTAALPAPRRGRPIIPIPLASVVDVPNSAGLPFSFIPGPRDDAVSSRLHFVFFRSGLGSGGGHAGCEIKQTETTWVLGDVGTEGCGHRGH
ncbi:hypothetical protein QBC39DRAFT_109605 [Podospora conica]|nr:hypothetical protein QBC39DRAFT_109605 [Schizothecium conicum]